MVFAKPSALCSTWTTTSKRLPCCVPIRKLFPPGRTVERWLAGWIGSPLRRGRCRAEYNARMQHVRKLRAAIIAMFFPGLVSLSIGVIRGWFAPAAQCHCSGEVSACASGADMPDPPHGELLNLPPLESMPIGHRFVSARPQEPALLGAGSLTTWGPPPAVIVSARQS